MYMFMLYQWSCGRLPILKCFCSWLGVMLFFCHFVLLKAVWCTLFSVASCCTLQLVVACKKVGCTSVKGDISTTPLRAYPQSYGSWFCVSWCSRCVINVFFVFFLWLFFINVSHVFISFPLFLWKYVFCSVTNGCFHPWVHFFLPVMP